MANKRKTTTAIVAGVTAAALLLGGTFAWTSISQQAKNEAIVDINPGGRLHDDFNGTNKDVYVENFGDETTGVPIYARIRLDQYFEVGQDAGINKTGENRKVTQILGGNINEVDTWETYTPGDLTDTSQVQANDNWQWNLGREMDEDGDGATDLPYYMPTFNMNKDSLAADINGTYEGTKEGDIVHYDDYKPYQNDSTEVGTEVYDWDDEDNDEEPNPDITYDETTPRDSADVYHKVEQTHTAAQVTYGSTVISMQDWLALPAEERIGDFWVYDEDGWAYWANYIAPGETTGLLLDSINMSRVPDDNYYYGINVVGQFATASDWEMLYEDTANGGGGSMTEDAKTLMELITATAPTEDGGEDDNTLQVLELTAEGTNIVEINPGDSVKVVSDDDNADMSAVKVSYWTDFTDDGTPIYTELDADSYTYDAETGELYIIDYEFSDDYRVTDNSGNVSGYLNLYYESDATTLSIAYAASGEYSEINQRGYIMPGEHLMLSASTSDGQHVNNEDCTWTASCGEGHPCSFDATTGILEISDLNNDVHPHLITVTCNYVNDEQGLNLTADFHIMISDEDLIFTTTADGEKTTGTALTLSTIVSTATDGPIDLGEIEWSYTIVDKDGNYIGDNDDAAINGDQFMAFKTGTYYVAAGYGDYFLYAKTPSAIAVTSGEEMNRYYAMTKTYDEDVDEYIYSPITVGTENADLYVVDRSTEDSSGGFDNFESATDGITLSYDEEFDSWYITVADSVTPGEYTLTYTIYGDEQYNIPDTTGTIDLVIDAANA